MTYVKTLHYLARLSIVASLPSTKMVNSLTCDICQHAENILFVEPGQGFDKMSFFCFRHSQYYRFLQSDENKCYYVQSVFHHCIPRHVCQINNLVKSCWRDSWLKAVWDWSHIRKIDTFIWQNFWIIINLYKLLDTRFKSYFWRLQQIKSIWIKTKRALAYHCNFTPLLL